MNMEELAKKQAEVGLEYFKVMVNGLSEKDVSVLEIGLKEAYMRGFMDGKVAALELHKEWLDVRKEC